MAVHYCFAASKLHNSVPCLSDSLSLTELKDAIVAPLVAALDGRKMKEAFDFRIFDSDTKTEILGANSRIRKNASVIVKRVPYLLLKTRLSSNVAAISTISTQSIERSINASSTRSEVIDDEFGDDIYSAPPVQKPNSKNAQIPSIASTCSEVIDGEFGGNVYSTPIMGEAVRKSSKKRAAPSDKVISSKRRMKEKIQSVSASKQMVEAVNVKSKQETGKGESEYGVQFVEKTPNELTCLLCNKILKEPMMIPCCFLTFCGDCIKVALAKQKKCPKCQSCKFGVTNLLQNRHLNIMIDSYLKSSSCASKVP